MKSFLKSLVASILGCSIVIGCVLILGFFILVAIASFSSKETYTLKENTVLNIKLEGVLQDRVEPNPLMELLDQSAPTKMALDEILSAIKKAKENDKIKGIYINAGIFSASSASLKEIRDALVDFKDSGKFIIAYGDTYMQGAYYLSSVADEVMINPIGNIDLHGLSSGPTFYKGLLDKLGIEMQVFKVGTFKSAVEPFMLEKMSDANKEQVSSYITDIWSTITTDISKSREISVEKLNIITDSLPLLQKANTYVVNHLVDTLIYETAVKEYIQAKLGVEKKGDVNYATVSDLTTVPYVNTQKNDDVVAILYAEGTISDGSGRDGITDKRYVKELEKLKDNDKVKAVVFRVNSGGGSAYASEQIWKAVSNLKEKKPVVVSMGDYAASGGYYISCNASKIIAQPNTLTGSIGIFGIFPNIEGLTNKVGLSFDNVKTNHFSDFGEISRPMRDEEKVLLQNYIEDGYKTFTTRCAEGRNIPIDSLLKIAEGRVWTGNQALKLGLVDAIGGIELAVKEAAKLAKIENYSLNSYPTKMTFIESLLLNQKEEFTTRAMKEYLGSDYNTLKMIKEIKGQSFIQARLPYDFSVE